MHSDVISQRAGALYEQRGCKETWVCRLHAFETLASSYN